MKLRFLLTPSILLVTSLSPANEEPVDPASFNAKIAEAVNAGKEWTADPSQIAAHLIGPWVAQGKESGSLGWKISATINGEELSSGVDVTVTEDGLLDDATRRIDHRFTFALVNGSWSVTKASVKYHNARPPYPLREEENVEKARAGIILLQQVPVPALGQAAEDAGITDLPSTVFATLEGDAAALNTVLNLSTKVSGFARQDYARLLFGLSCFFEKPGFNRYLYMNLDEQTSTAVREILRQVEDGELP
ncbi:MAG: hypothetical protein P1U68_06705 [Verrucomicrobiales bacterium]|nr:hypothetical protein [Verrucomicrobiales bacterium]